MITYDDFAKLDIRIGTILEAEKIPEGDKLLKLKINIGEEERQVMAGIAEFKTNPEELVGKQIPVLVNLEPRMLRGYESQGMILATGDGESFALLHPEKEVKPGSQVK